MTVGRLGERGIINRLTERFTATGHTVRLTTGIGDDAAVAAFSGDPCLVLTTDVLVDGVHFSSDWTPPRCLGHKALAASLSDLAAMGAEPELFLLDLALPADWPVDALDAMATGMAALAARAGIALAGGDTVSSTRLHVGVTAVGRVQPGRELLRAGGRPGDRLVITGAVGAAAAGLLLLRSGWRLDGETVRPPAAGSALAPEAAAAVILAHLMPEPEIEAGRRLAGWARAAIDLSDGLSQDLHNLCEASACGARLEVKRVPVDTAARVVWTALDRDPLEEALAGGEDYRLLVAASGEGTAPVDVHPVGILTEAGKGVVLEDAGEVRPLDRRGFRHFPGP